MPRTRGCQVAALALTAPADCTNAGGVSVCARGDVRGPDGAPAPYYPYPCEYDYLCYDGGLSIALDIGNGPLRPGGGGGNRPGGGGGNIGPR